MASLRQARRSGSYGANHSADMRWALQGALPVLMLALVAWAGWTLWNPQSFPLRTIRLTTPVSHVTQDEIRSVVAEFSSAGFVRVDMDGMQKSLEELPWVYTTSLRRVWPDVIEIGITEQVPVARWEAGGLVNEHGAVFTPKSDEAQSQLPLFAGPEGTGKVLVDMQKELNDMVASLGLRIRRIELSERRAWSIELDNGLLLSLGRSDTVPRVQRFVKTYSEAIAPHIADIKQIDLRYTNGFAIRWRDDHVPSV